MAKKRKVGVVSLESELRLMLKRIVAAWESVPETVQVPDEININEMWRSAKELLNNL